MYANIFVINYISRYTHIIHIYPLLYERFFAMENTHFSSECDKYGEEVDRLTIQKDYDGLESYITELETFASSHNTSEYAPIFYYLGNAYATLADYKKRVKKHNEETAHRKLVLYYLRQALSHVKDCTNPSALLLCIYTNYANELDACGRVIEALKIYRKAISLNPNFSMAIGNYGRALQFYGNLVNDSGHCKELHCYAYQAIIRALELRDPISHKEAIQTFERIIQEYNDSPWKDFLSKPIVFDKYDMGEPQEQAYREWCLNNHLFLNPLNDLIDLESAFAHDPLTITKLTENVNQNDVDNKSKGNPPKWFAMLNQLKEEYIYSRLLCYEGIEKLDSPHYADKHVKLSLSSFDYVNYSIRLEQLKSAFKTLYSIFDQVAFMINEYWKLGLPERKADAYNVFRKENFPTNNIALSALYWSHLEFMENFGDADNPSEKSLKTLRHAIEHKFVKIHEYPFDNNLQLESDSFYHISEQDLKEYVLRLLELSREWIMELVYAISLEESKNKIVDNSVSLHIRDYEDDWKT